MINLYVTTEHLAILLFYKSKNPRGKQEQLQTMFDFDQCAKTKGAKISQSCIRKNSTLIYLLKITELQFYFIILYS